MPSRVTAVPGSQGPRQSGSVMVEALQVPTQASAFVLLGTNPPVPPVKAAGEPAGLDEEEEEDGTVAGTTRGCTPLTKWPVLGGVTAISVTLLLIRLVPVGWAGGGGLGSGT